MGLLDVFNGMQNGPGGSRGLGGMGGGGMSPITMALLGLLAYKAVKGFSGSTAPAGSPPPAPGGGAFGGLGDLIKQFQGAGKSDVANSWVSTGQNQPITPSDLNKVLTPEQIDFLATRTGLSHEELLAGLSEHLPKAVDHLTPEGRLPTSEEMNRAV
jgi:uncharacterized protein YidB (DUF937 family)